MIEIKEGKIRGNLGKYYKPFFSPYSAELVSIIKKYKREDIAAAAQAHLENILIEYINYNFANKTDVRSPVNMMLSGGVFGNVKLNQKIKESKYIKNIYVQPQMGDGGLCLGAAALASHYLDENKIDFLNSMYLGPAVNVPNNIDGYDIEEYSIENKSIIKFCDDLKNNKVIGLMQGRMEFGPRALCNRSIIYKTSDKKINDWLNKRMDRTEFMPFAPIIKKENASKCIKNFDYNDASLNFMTSTVDIYGEFKKRCPAVVHIDETARPQLISKKDNNFIWKVLTQWENISGELGLVNTSFNRHEEPIVNTFNEGLSGLDINMIDVLWVIDGDMKIRRISRSS